MTSLRSRTRLAALLCILLVTAGCSVASETVTAGTDSSVDPKAPVKWIADDPESEYGHCVDQGRFTADGAPPGRTTKLPSTATAARIRIESVGPLAWNSPDGYQWRRPLTRLDATTGPLCFRPVTVVIEAILNRDSPPIGEVGNRVTLQWLGDGDPGHGKFLADVDTRFGGVAGPVAAGETRIVAVDPRPTGFWPSDKGVALLVGYAPTSYLVVDGLVRLADGSTVSSATIETGLTRNREAPTAPHGMSAFDPKATQPNP